MEMDPYTKRSLLLISKVLQKIANGSKFGTKESFMIPLNEFLEQNERKMREILNHCINSGDQVPL
jgi:hypothetical protein